MSRGARSRPSITWQAGAVLLAVATAGPFVFVACGGEETKPPVTPTAPSASAAPPPAPTATVHADVSAAAKAAYARGYAAYTAGDLSAAKQAFLEASRADASAPAPLTALGNVQEHMGDTSGALQQYKAALAVKSDDVTAIGAYAMCLASSGQAPQADTFLTSQLAKHPDSAPITTFLSEVKSIEGDSATAQQLAQDALRINPDFKPAMVAIAHDHYRAKRLELAKYALQAVLDGFGETSPPRDRDNADAHLIRGLIEENGHLRAAAMADFEAARKSRPDSVEALIHLGVMKLQAGNVLEATPVLESAVKFAPTSPLAHLNLADAYRLGTRVADAKREFDKALSMDSSLSVAHYDMGLLYLFSPNVPGTTALDQIATAIRELQTFQSMRGPKPAPGAGDDVDELLARAQAKQADLKVTPAPTPAPSPPPAPAASAKPSTPATPAAGSAKPPATPSSSAPPAPAGSAKLAPWPADSAKK
jgi:Tfp pilus assembly protein PilF